MARGRQREPAAGPSQRSLRVGACALYVWLAGFSSTPAFAEVCDKAAGDNWQPADGPVWMLNPSAPAIAEYVFIALGILLLATVRRPWAGYLAAAIVSALALFIVSDLVSMDSVNVAARLEGCRSYAAGLADIFLLSVAAVLFAWTGRRFQPMRTATP